MTSIFLNDVSSSSRPNPYTLSVSSRYPKAFHLRETSGASSQVVSQKLSHQSINMHKYVRFFGALYEKSHRTHAALSRLSVGKVMLRLNGSFNIPIAMSLL